MARPAPTPAPDGQARPGGRQIVTAANALTLLRIGLVPVFVVLMVASGMTEFGYRIGAVLAFTVASVTDFVDGRLARAMNQVTPFGQVADPIADKALTGTALVLLSIYHTLPWWVTIVIMARELGVTALRFWVIRRGVIAATKGGKVKTVLQIVAISWYICPFPSWLAAIGPWIMGAALIVTVGTGVDYVVRAVRLHLRRA